MKKILPWLIIMLLSISFVSAVDFVINFTTRNSYSESLPNIQVKQLKYEPYPVNPGEYFDLWIKAENVGEEPTENAVFELIPKYPFSLDAGEEALREYGQLGIKPVVLEYKVRVDEDAVEGTNEIELRYKADADDSVWFYETFEIQVADAQTDFDLVVQEINENEVSIAIANIGKNVAYSVIVRVPEQESFKANGISGQMVGNLEDGDYTLVGFEIVKTARSDEPLELQIDYTDNIGERRSLIKEVAFSMGTNELPVTNTLPEGVTREDFIARRRSMMQTQQAIYQKWWFWAIIIVFAFVAWKGYKAHRRKREEKEEKKHKK